MEWFESWFNSPYYHILYKHRDDYEAHKFIDNLCNFLQLKKDSKILDLACGKGRHAIYWNSQGFDVTGIDLSTESIASAREFKNDRLSFHVHDMRTVFKENYFDYIFSFFSSFGYFDTKDEDDQVIESVAKALKQNAVFLLDFMNVVKVGKSMVNNEVQEVEGILFHIERKVVDGFVRKVINFSDNDNSYLFEEKVRAYEKDQIVEMFEKNGLTVKNIYGDYYLNEFNEVVSDRLIIMGAKK